MLIRTKRLVLSLAVAALALSAGDASGQFRRPFMPELHVGPAAKDAVPKLVAAVKSKDEDLSLAAGEALLRIDPDAAKKAGIP